MRLNRPRWRRKYSEIVRGIRDMDDLREVCAAAAARNRSVVALSIYSQPERSNLRVAAKFRRLALQYQRDAACCEAAGCEAPFHGADTDRLSSETILCSSNIVDRVQHDFGGQTPRVAASKVLFVVAVMRVGE